MSDTLEDTPGGRSFFRFWFPWVALVVAAGIVTFAWTWPGEGWERAGRVATTIMTGAATFLVITLWLFILSRRHWWMFIFIVAGLAAATFIVVKDIKKDGDIVPFSVRFVWEPTHDELLEAHRREQGQIETPAEASQQIADTDYPEYRNRRRDGVVTGPALNRDFKASPPAKLWRQPVGGGYAGFVIAGDMAVTIEQRRDREAVIGYDATSGQERWVHDYEASFNEALGGPGPRATPTIVGDAVYSLGATGWLVCLERATGKPRWSVNILENNANLAWAMSGSPLVYDDVVVVNPGTQSSAANGKAVVACDRKTGKPVWTAGSTRAGYCSPMLATLAGQRQVLIFDAEELAGYDPATGKKLWRQPWETYQGINVAQPIVYPDDRVFISAGYNHGSAMLKISKHSGEWQVAELWKNTNMRSKFSSPVAYHGYLYGFDDGTLVCLDEKDGSRKWKGDRYGHGQLLLSGDLLVILSERGKLVLVEATPQEHRPLTALSAIEGRTWNYPALANGKVYVRNDLEMAGYDLTKK